MSSQQMKILLVDDYELMRTMLKNALNKLGYDKIDQAANGVIAHEKLVQAIEAGSPYSMIFCDWNMPEMTGLELLQKCRSTSDFQTLPFIMVTAEAEQDSVIRALEAGATEYLIKPISPAAVERKVNRIVAKMGQKAI